MKTNSTFKYACTFYILVLFQSFLLTAQNGGETYTLADDVLNTSLTCDLTLASLESTSPLLNCFVSVGNGDTLGRGNCESAGCFENNAYYYTDYKDLWYVINIPLGTDEFSVAFTGLSCNIGIIPYSTGSVGSLQQLNVSTSGSGGIVDSDNDGNIENENGNRPFIGSDGFIHFKGADVLANSGSPIYLRVFAHDNRATGAACNESDIIKCAFNISVTAPQPNDTCNNALNINSFDNIATNNPDSFLAITQSGDISLANVDADVHDNVNGTTCNGINFNTNEQDLWYSVRTPDNGSNYFLDVDIEFTGVSDEIYVLLHNYCANNDSTPIGCATISADGIVSFDADNITNFNNALTPNNDFNIRIVLPSGSTATSFNISANLIAENNTCEVMQQTFPGFDADPGNGSSTDFNMNFATDSGATPTVVGRDLWYQFNPLTSTDIYGFLTASTTAMISIGGLDTGEEIELLLYKGQSVSANNCVDLAGDYIESLSVSGNGVFELSCLDEMQTTVSGGYLIRIIQTAGSTIIDNGLINVDPQPAGPFNNDCENIWNGSGPRILGVPGEPQTNPYVILPGFSNFRSGDFENSTDCNPNINSAICNGIDQQAITANEDRDLWYAITIPSSAGACDLSTSTIINNIKFLYNAGNASRDGIIYLYDGCDDSNLISCSGVLDGAPAGAGDDQFNDNESTWTVSGLIQGNSYLVRVKPYDIGSSGIGNEFSFDISWKPSDPVPCNDSINNPEVIGPYISGSDYTAGCTTGNADGATNNGGTNTGSNSNNVWFEFTAEDNADEEGYVNIYLQSLSNGGSGSNFPLTINVYKELGGSGGIGQIGSSFTNTDGDGWVSLGHLIPGEDYFIEILHSQLSGVEVLYNICLYDIPTNTIPCASDSVSISPAGGGECSSPYAQDCALYYRIEVPAGTPSGWYIFEAIGNGMEVDIQLFNQDATNSPSTEGASTDYDQPCASLGGSTSGLNSMSGAQVSIPPAGAGICNNGSGESAVYNLIGSSSSESLYYYLEVRDAVGLSACDFTAANICSINVSGPFSTQALAETNTTLPDGNCVITTCVDPIITIQPTTTQSVCQNSVVTALSVTATGTTLSYQWYSNTINSTTGGTLIPGANSSTYTPSSSSSGTLYYYVVVTENTDGPCSISSNTSEVIIPVFTFDPITGNILYVNDQSIIDDCIVGLNPSDDPSNIGVLGSITNPFNNLSAAIAAASNGDRILIGAGIYNNDNNITVNKSISIEGCGLSLIHI